MRLSAKQWKDLVGADEVIGETGFAYDEVHRDVDQHPGYWSSDWIRGVGAVATAKGAYPIERFDETGGFFDTDVETYAERVNTMIMQLDRSLRPVFEGKAPGELGQGDRDDWDLFMGDPTLCQAVVEDGEIQEDECVDYDAEATPFPTGWTSYKAHIGSGRLITLAGNKDSAIRHIGNYEKAYADFRDKFVARGVQTTAPEPTHPGIFETLEEQEKRKAGETNWGDFAKWGLIIAAVAAIGYTVTGVARLKGS